MTVGVHPATISDLPPQAPPVRARREAGIVAWLGGRPIVLVGMMGAGKTVVGRRLGTRLELPFLDSDHEIETCAQLSISEIFARHGETYFRDKEQRVVTRLVTEGGRVLATGGGSFMHPATRAVVKDRALSVWLKADFDVLMRRVRKRQTRPLLQTPDPEGTLRGLIEQRYPTYAEADITVVSRDGPHETVVEEVLSAIEARAAAEVTASIR